MIKLPAGSAVIVPVSIIGSVRPTHGGRTAR